MKPDAKTRHRALRISLLVAVVVGFFLLANYSEAAEEAVPQEKLLELENRLNSLEAYVEKIQPTLVEFSDNLHESIKKYTQELEDSLNGYSQKLEANLEERLRSVDTRKVVLNPFSKAYQRIDTNSGYFLISVQDMKPIENGFRLVLHIGNPNYADFSEFKVRLFWGKAWDPNSTVSYEDWRRSLSGSEYVFQGTIKKGMWNPMEVDLVPADTAQLGYLECELVVASVELQSK